MRVNRYIIGTLVVSVLLVGCAEPQREAAPRAPGNGAGESGSEPAPDADPVELIGLWSVTGVEDGRTLRLGDRMTVWRDCGSAGGVWRADASGLFIAHISYTSGCGEVDEPTPAWLRDAAGFRVDADGAVLLDVQGEPVARLVPGATPPPGSESDQAGTSSPAATDEARRSLAPAAALPAGLTPVDRAALVGRWVPATGASSTPKRPHVELDSDGAWRGSDGCNATGGRWVAGSQGAMLAVSGPSTLIACDGAVPIGSWLTMTRRAGFEGGTLVLLDAEGGETGRLQPAG